MSETHEMNEELITPENSQANEQNNEEVQGENNAETAETDSPDNFEQKYNETYDRYLRLVAEFENYKKRAVKERMDLVKTAGADVVSAILPVADDFNRAFKSLETATELEAVKEGLELIYKKFWKVLSDKGLEEMMPAVGEDFNADVHEAVTQIPAPTEELKGKILDVVEKGFLLNGKILRYPKVVVGS
jgi:molecular chaperone GrpE